MRCIHPPRRVSIAWKLTGFFFLFGVVLSYGAFLAYGRVTTTLALRVGAQVASGVFANYFGSGDAAAMRALSGASNERLAALERSLPFLTSHDAYSGLRLYGRLPDGEWASFTPGDNGYVASSLVDERSAAALARAASRRVAVEQDFENLTDRSLPAFLSLPTGPDGTAWAIGADVDIEGITEFLSRNGRETVNYALILALLSLALGRVFAARFTRPIARLADAADAYRKGEVAAFEGRRRDELGVLGRTLNAMADEIESRRAETASRLASMEAMNRIDRAVLTMSSRRELFPEVAAIVSESLGRASVAVALRDDERGGWGVAAMVGPDGQEINPGGFPPFVSDELLGPDRSVDYERYYELPVRSSHQGVAAIACDLLGATGGWLVSAPFRVDRRYVGSLVVALDRAGPLSVEERRSLVMLADQTGVAVRSILEHEAREDNFLGVISSLTRAIDAKSRWTAGHSERVALAAVRLGEALGLPPADVYTLRVAALLHDVGKIGVGEAVLDKPGRLDPEELAAIRRHPELGASMLGGIRAFEAVVPAVLYHHERWDGTGYPARLAGTDIPQLARIITVVDVWDAISEDRPYRAGFEPEEALRFMQDQSALMFDPDIVRAFLAEVLPSLTTEALVDDGVALPAC